MAILAGCIYHPGSFEDPVGTSFPGTRATVGCLDVAVAAAKDDRATGPVIEYSFGNRCDHRVVVDLRGVRAVGRDATGQTRELRLFDPDAEVKPAELDALVAASEQLEYLDRDGAALLSVCVDIGGVESDTPRREQWICVAS